MMRFFNSFSSTFLFGCLLAWRVELWKLCPESLQDNVNILKFPMIRRIKSLTWRCIIICLALSKSPFAMERQYLISIEVLSGNISCKRSYSSMNKSQLESVDPLPSLVSDKCWMRLICPLVSEHSVDDVELFGWRPRSFSSGIKSFKLKVLKRNVKRNCSSVRKKSNRWCGLLLEAQNRLSVLLRGILLRQLRLQLEDPCTDHALIDVGKVGKVRRHHLLKCCEQRSKLVEISPRNHYDFHLQHRSFHPATLPPGSRLRTPRQCRRHASSSLRECSSWWTAKGSSSPYHDAAQCSSFFSCQVPAKSRQDKWVCEHSSTKMALGSRSLSRREKM